MFLHVVLMSDMFWFLDYFVINDTSTTWIYTSRHTVFLNEALPIWSTGVTSQPCRLAIAIGCCGGMALWVYGMGALAEWSAFKRYGIVATAFILAYKAPDLYLKNKINKRTDAIRKGLPDALDLLVICA